MNDPEQRKTLITIMKAFNYQLGTILKQDPNAVFKLLEEHFTSKQIIKALEPDQHQMVKFLKKKGFDTMKCIEALWACEWDPEAAEAYLRSEDGVSPLEPYNIIPPRTFQAPSAPRPAPNPDRVESAALGVEIPKAENNKVEENPSEKPQVDEPENKEEERVEASVMLKPRGGFNLSRPRSHNREKDIN